MKQAADPRLLAMSIMLTEMARGNFSFRLDRTDKNDIIEALVAILNMTAEELESSFMHQGYINSRTSYFNRVKLFFLLDKDDRILAINPEAVTLLNRTEQDLLHSNFSDLLRNGSKEQWNQHATNFDSNNSLANYLELVFEPLEKLPLVLSCDILQLTTEPGNPTMKIVVSARIKRNKIERESRNYRQALLKSRLNLENSALQNKSITDFGINITYEDVNRIRQVRDYLLNNLDKPIDPLVDLARLFGTNEYKLKHGFKQLNGETISVFIQKERLKMAAVLIEHSDHLIKEIAVMTGFKSTAHFSRNFKKHLGVSPKQYRQNLNQ